MMFFNVVLRLGASPDSRTTTPPSPVVVNRSLSRVKSRPREETLDPTVTSAEGIHPLYLVSLVRNFVGGPSIGALLTSGTKTP